MLIASPSDVGEERKIAESVVHEWNTRHKSKYGIWLEPVLWETHTAPEAGERLQGSVNEQIVDECHCAIAIFWTRIGTDTGVAPSGTVEEIEQMVKNKKHIMVYFSDVPVSRSQVDKEQEAKLDEFKAIVTKKWLTHSFSDRNKFEHDLSRHLDLQIPRWFGDPDSQPADPPQPDSAADLQCYQSTLKEELRWIRMLGLPNIERIDVNLDDDTFVPLRFTRSRKFAPDGPERMHSMLEENILTPDRVMQEAFKSDRRMLLVIGDPGAGKTTLLKYYALCCLGPERFSRLGFAEPVNVFYLPLRELVKKDDGGFHHLADSLARWASANQLEIDRKLFDGWLRQSRSLVLLDGLDEIGSVEERKKACRWIEGAWKSYTGARFVVTSRRTGYRKDDGVELEVDHDRADVEDFTREQQERFLANWFRAAFLRDYNDARLSEAEWQSRQEHRAEERTTKIVAHLREEGNRSLRQLAAIPMILQIMAILWKERDHLPNSRVDLYNSVLDYLLQFRDARRNIKPLLPARDARMVLGPVSLWMQEQKEDDAEKGAMRSAMDERLCNLDKSPSAQDFCDYLVDRAGLLMEYGKQSYVFRHKSFREFLAGIELVKKVNRTSGYLDPIIKSFGEDWWEEPLRFFIAHGDEELFELFMDKLFSSNVSDDVLQQKQLFLRTLIEEAPMKKPDALCEHLMKPENSAMRQRVILDCIRAVDKESSIVLVRKFVTGKLAKDEDASGRAIEVLIELDATHSEYSLPDRLWSYHLSSGFRASPSFHNPFEQYAQYILIKGGSYVYSVTKKEVKVSDLYFAKYPVTNRLYRRFIDYLRSKSPECESLFPVSGFQEELQKIANEKTWDTKFADYLNEGKSNLAGWFRSMDDDDRKFGGAEQPVVSIPWYAARSYCLWLSLMESKGKKFDLYRLPMEIEWEWAAAGKERRRYPWGAEKPSTKRAGGDNVDLTTPVGSCPEGATPEGLYDMVGNVWQWQENSYDDTKIARALRGSPNSGYKDKLRCTWRYYLTPGSAGSFFGFRVVRSADTLKS
ncbi:SUMF1/EgtB/PvdO family nonheme iron enzyme [Chlorobaculum parvum]|uniref:SUMF1/EgtB/PvdO family nonheme iron enzyme n=1 Tax=Chlorobaculum parvum TaxID=274539 RepID=UPI001E5A6EB4|nr:SUMF1/EgtB/PvdO family nonheme iron enzyme [Chlorobaculum parvum]